MRSRKYFISALLLMLVIFLNLPAEFIVGAKRAGRDGIAPFQNMMSFIINTFGRGFSALAGLRGSVEERRKMEEEIADLRFQVRNMKTLDYENEELRRNLNYMKKRKERLIFCEVVVRMGSSGWWQSLRLNRGYADGIQVNMPVITSKGLVGRVVEVSRHTSDVLLITDTTSKVACRLSRTKTLGVMKGMGLSPVSSVELEMLCPPDDLQMDYVDKNTEVFGNDQVETSGLGGVYPEGLLVGTVRDMELDPSGLYQILRIVPQADMTHLRYVFVVASIEPEKKKKSDRE